ncbi:MAG TPA: O-methyltransferase [Tepidisphaeraceae bacterium]|jgi:predicted O-methyltransferase YrrM|nr:O-methyltransferase [Tepidisphaeraceae bacterium]
MNKEQWKAVDRYIVDALVKQDEALEAALVASSAAGLPAIAVSPNQGKLLMLLAKMVGARRILEIGTLAGYSTIWLARGLAGGGKLITLEMVEKHAQVARANLARAGLAEVVEVMVGPALETLPKIAAAGRGPFDLIFIDADKSAMTDYLEWSLKLSRPGTVIIGDNVVRDGKVLDAASSDPSVQGIRRFYEMLSAEKRLSATAIQMVGAKGYDGFAVGVVLE